MDEELTQAELKILMRMVKIRIEQQSVVWEMSDSPKAMRGIEAEVDKLHILLNKLMGLYLKN